MLFTPGSQSVKCGKQSRIQAIRNQMAPSSLLSRAVEANTNVSTGSDIFFGDVL